MKSRKNARKRESIGQGVLEMINVDRITEKVLDTVNSHELSEGAYARWTIPAEGTARNMGVNEYGCADAANIL